MGAEVGNATGFGGSGLVGMDRKMAQKDQGSRLGWADLTRCLNRNARLLRMLVCKTGFLAALSTSGVHGSKLSFSFGF